MCEVNGSPWIISTAVKPPLIIAVVHFGDSFATMIADYGGYLIISFLDDAQGHGYLLLW